MPPEPEIRNMTLIRRAKASLAFDDHINGNTTSDQNFQPKKTLG